MPMRKLLQQWRTALRDNNVRAHYVSMLSYVQLPKGWVRHRLLLRNPLWGNRGLWRICMWITSLPLHDILQPRNTTLPNALSTYPM